MTLLAAPLTPDAGQARRWARDELAQEVYAEAEPDLLSRTVSWLLEQLSRLELPDTPGSRLWLVALLVAVAVGVLVALRLAGPVRLRRRRPPAGDVLGGTTRTAAEHRRAADEAAAAGRWDVAVQERFRAIARALDERALVTLGPGRTADEVAREAAVVLPAHADELREAARVFDDVRYGGRPAGPTQDERLRRLDTALAATRPLQDVGPVPAVGAATAGRR